MTQDLSAGAVSVDGVVTAPADARVSAMDHGFLFGDSVYEVVRTYRGQPVAYPEHLRRLRASAAEIYMDIPWDDARIRASVAAAVEATGLAECAVRIVVTRGVGPMSLLPDECASRSLVVYVLPLRVPDPEHVANGVAVAVPPRLRNDRRALAPAAKTGNYLNNLLALVEGRRAGGYDSVLINADGHVTEGTTSNVFWVRDGDLRTPSLDVGILAGITREMLLAELQEEGIPVTEGRFALDDLLGAEEAFLTGTIKGALPVVRVDDAVVGDGRPGPRTRRVGELLERAMSRHTGPW